MLFLLRWLIGVCAVFAVFLFAKGIEVSSVYAALMLSLTLGLANAVAPALIGAFTIARTILTVGLAILLTNAFLLYLAQSLHAGFTAQSYNSLLLAAIIISTITWFTSLALEPDLFPKK